MSKGAKAMIYAKRFGPATLKRKGSGSTPEASFSHDLLTRARLVLKVLPEAADAVLLAAIVAVCLR